MALTLNKVVERIRTLALSHLQINSFFDGDVHEFDVNGDINYATCFLEQLPGTLDRAEKQHVYNFRLYFLDRVGVSENSEGNEREVLSDMSSISEDFFAMLNYPNYDDWTVGLTASETPVTEALGDMVAGVFIDVSIGVDFNLDRCQVPTTMSFV